MTKTNICNETKIKMIANISRLYKNNDKNKMATKKHWMKQREPRDGEERLVTCDVDC